MWFYTFQNNLSWLYNTHSFYVYYLDTQFNLEVIIVCVNFKLNGLLINVFLLEYQRINVMLFKTVFFSIIHWYFFQGRENNLLDNKIIINRYINT